MGRRPRTADVLALAALTVLVLWVFREAVGGGGVFYQRDIHLVWVPQVEAIVRSLAVGQFPLWDPLASFGQPLLADPSAEVLYPPTLLNLLMQPWTYYTLFASGHVLFSAFCAYGLGRHWRLGPLAAFVMASAWVLSGPFISLVDLWHHLAGAAWIPAVTWLAVRAAERPTVRRAIAVAAGAGLQALAGSFDMCVLTGLLVAAVVAWRHVRWRPLISRENGRLLACAGVATVGAVALAAGLWMPALDLVRHGSRSELSERTRTYWSVHPVGLVDIVAGGVFEDVPLRPDLTTRLFEGREPFFRTLYLGAVVVGLMLAGVFASSSPMRGPMVVVGTVATLVSLGRHAPFYQAAVTLMPPLATFRYPVKYTVLMAFCGAVLAGLGVHAWSNLDSRRQGWGSAGWRWGFAALTACVAATALLIVVQPIWIAQLLVDPGFSLGPDQALSRLRSDLVRESLALTAACVLVWASWTRPRRAVVAVATVLAVGDLVVQHRHPNPTAPRQFYALRPEAASAIGDPRTTRLYVYDYSVDGAGARFLDGGRGLAMRRFIEGWDPLASMAWSYEARLAPATASRWEHRTGFDVDLRGLQPRALMQLTVALRTVEDEGARLRLLQLGGITHVVALHEGSFRNLIPGPTIQGLGEAPVRIFTVPDTLDEAFLVPAAEVAPGQETLRALLDPRFDPRRTVLLEGGPTQRPTGPLRGRIVSLERTPNRVSIDVDVDREAFLVLLDTWDAGWHAQLDGRRTKSYVANLAFRAVAVPPGRHRVVWTYRPWPAMVGIGLTGGTALALTVAWVALGRRRMTQ